MRVVINGRVVGRSQKGKTENVVRREVEKSLPAFRIYDEMRVPFRNIVPRGLTTSQSFLTSTNMLPPAMKTSAFSCWLTRSMATVYSSYTDRDSTALDQFGAVVATRISVTPQVKPSRRQGRSKGPPLQNHRQGTDASRELGHRSLRTLSLCPCVPAIRATRSPNVPS